MKIKKGDIIIYYFPYILNKLKNKIVGEVDFVGDGFIYVKGKGDKLLLVSQESFENIKKIGSIEKIQPASKNPIPNMIYN